MAEEQMEQLTEKYRPRKLADIKGQNNAVQVLSTILKRESGFPKSYLFTGPKGCGKTTMAFALANEFGVDSNDTVYLNTANTRGIDTIRDLENKLQYKSFSGGFKFAILDECHKLTNDAQNALLPILENPPKHVFLALCTTDPEKLLPTIKSRCIQTQVALFQPSGIKDHLNWICQQEGIDNFPQSILSEIARAADGSMRDAINILDTVIDIEEDDVALEAVKRIGISETEIREIGQLLLKSGGGKDKWKQMAALVLRLEMEPEQARLSIAGYLTAVLLKGHAEDRIAEMLGCFLETVMYTKRSGLTYQLYLACQVG